MKSLSTNALDKYRKYAKRDKNIPNDVLKIKLNCLIGAVEKSHIRKTSSCIIYQFGSCLIHVNGNIITNLRWTETENHPTNYEIAKMLQLFSENSLNKNGNKIILRGD